MLQRSLGRVARALFTMTQLPSRPNGDRVLFTFDDGPHPDVTPRILDLLAQYDARAVFFVVGQRIPRAPHLLRSIVEAGHALGNHTYAHATRPLPMTEYYRDMVACQQIVEDLSGTSPTLFRPPGGRVTPAMLFAARRSNLRIMLWSFDSGDWRAKTTEAAKAAASRAVQWCDSHPTLNDIVLLHDDNPSSLSVLEAMLVRLSSRNCDLASAPYPLVTASA